MNFPESQLKRDLVGGGLPWRDQWRLALGWKRPERLRADIVAAQYRRINDLAPWLYLAIASMAAVGAYGAGGAFSWSYHVLIPGFFLTIGFVRAAVWHRRRGKAVSQAKMIAQVKASAWFALILAGAGSIWTLEAFYHTLEARRVLAPVFVAFVAMAASIGISALPRAAIGVLVIALSPSAIAMIFADDVGVRSVGMSMMVLLALMSAMVCHHFATLVESIRMARDLTDLAQTDPLTGLFNRRGFTHRFTAGEPHTLITIDLDEFKAANDRFGHEAGDAVLVEIARRLRQLCPDARCIARLGGDEFAVLLTAGSATRSEDLEHAIRGAIGLPVFHDGNAVVVGAAIGRATGENLDTLLRDADTMLYRHKRPDSRIAV